MAETSDDTPVPSDGQLSPQSTASGRDPSRPAKRQRRVALACQRCKTRKQRCDGGHPKCTSCSKTSNECVYVFQPAGATHHIKALEERVAELETALSFYGAAEVGDDHFRIAKLMPQEGAGSENGNDVFVAIRDLSLAASGHYVGGTSSLSIGRVLNSIVQSQQPTDSGTIDRDGPSIEDPSPRSLHDARLEQMVNLTSMDSNTADRLIVGWHRHIATRYPIIHTPRVTWLHANRARLTNLHDKCVLNLIYAVSGRWLESSGEGGYFFSDKHYDIAYQEMSSILKLRDSRSLDYLLLLTLYCTRAPRDPGAWTFIGLAIRQCIELGLHRDRHESGPTIDGEMAKRRFWAAYFLERDICIAIGRPFSLSDHDIDAPLPLDVNENLDDEEELRRVWQETMGTGSTGRSRRTSNLSPFIHRTKLKRIESEIQSVVYRVDQADQASDATIMDFLGRLEQWRADIPASAQTFKPQQHSGPYDGLEFFTIHYHRTVRFLLYPRLTTTPNMHYLKLCAQACSGIISDYRRLHQVFPVGFSALSIQSVFLAGLTLVYCAWLSPGFVEVESSFADCQLLLYVITERYPSAKKYRDIFERLRNAIRDLLQTGNHQPGAPVPSLALDPAMLQHDFADLLGQESTMGGWAAHSGIGTDFTHMINTMTGASGNVFEGNMWSQPMSGGQQLYNGQGYMEI
ncbi:putative transcriptional regulatory protein [Cyphellophora attinorum]|uniref:Putative transcriptional regulatory protein n=1 Tax=Cyphellophora attinorum TaxID=1664694 RepID=A0A0N1HCH4_9EURO|nr:putative transcriptional regulatory protein [Phialophora attinorum]KPI42053.1 putative transcriptional regulatory protein [Phialophora attinorum]